MSWQSFLFLLLLCSVIGLLIWKRHKDIQLLETVTSRYRGEWSERKTVLRLLKMGFDGRAIFHDCYMRRSSGRYTQIDLVVATRVGLLAFEIKDYSGWIFGHSHQKYWTQVLAYGKEKHRFYNPIMQNDGHIQAIRENLQMNHGIPIYSIIVFFGNCELRNVTISSDNQFIIYPNELRRTIRRILSHPNANFGNKHEIINVLTNAVKNGTIPEIVSAQLMTAQQAGQNRPSSHYSWTFNPLMIFKHLNRW